ncbi:MAG: ribosome biogenesis GTPase Der [Chloroflexi bacterium]|nr:ribosome biogenesis GTPase Der [Chloroflexota bacterium]
MPKPIVAFVGRPNVGKSTLFNRLVGRMESIVSDLPGTTRDRVMGSTTWANRELLLVDTGGIETDPEAPLIAQIKYQAQTAVEDADVIVMVVDANDGVTSGDLEVADLLRRADRPVVLAANKADNPSRESLAVEFYELGLSEPIPISAYHNIGVDDLVSAVIALLPSEEVFGDDESDVKLAIVGRTNVGKSQLINAIANEERAIVSDIAGTTRDTLDTLVTHNDKRILVLDTAGIRRRGAIQQGIEKFSVLRSVRAIERAEVAVVMMDATEVATAQDTHVAGFVTGAYRGVVLGVNKWDLAEERGITRDNIERHVKNKFKFTPYAPVCFLSALKGTGVKELLDKVCHVRDEWVKTVPRYAMQRAVLEAVAENPPPASGRGGGLKIYGIDQSDSGPPTFTFYLNKPELLHFSYARYLENAIRRTYGYEGTPIRFRLKGRGTKR